MGTAVADPSVAAAGGWPAEAPPPFSDDRLLDLLEAASIDRIDELDFGLIAMDRSGQVLGYNVCESQRAGIAREQVIGRNFFVDIGPCTNNHMVAERFHSGEDLDEEMDYVFTLRMAPTPVTLRLLAQKGSARQYLAVRFR
jgi:photoactive yellow protein